MPLFEIDSKVSIYFERGTRVSEIYAFRGWEREWSVISKFQVCGVLL